jgi:hypothetical protein
MGRSPIWPIITKLLMALCVLVLLGLFSRLVVAILQPILPPSLSVTLSAGFAYLVQLLEPALRPIIALFILALLLWAILSTRR